MGQPVIEVLDKMITTQDTNTRRRPERIIRAALLTCELIYAVSHFVNLTFISYLVDHRFQNENVGNLSGIPKRVHDQIYCDS
jgi:hypothetical protein